MRMSRVQAKRFIWLQRHPVAFHVCAWFNCSVPLIRGRLTRFTGVGPSA
jgi:hypothetical protein